MTETNTWALWWLWLLFMIVPFVVLVIVCCVCIPVAASQEILAEEEEKRRKLAIQQSRNAMKPTPVVYYSVIHAPPVQNNQGQQAPFVQYFGGAPGHYPMVYPMGPPPPSMGAPFAPPQASTAPIPAAVPYEQEEDKNNPSLPSYRNNDPAAQQMKVALGEAQQTNAQLNDRVKLLELTLRAKEPATPGVEVLPAATTTAAPKADDFVVPISSDPAPESPGSKV